MSARVEKGREVLKMQELNITFRPGPELKVEGNSAVCYRVDNGGMAAASCEPMAFRRANTQRLTQASGSSCP